MNLTEAAKRLLIGRKLASYQLGETLLPKRIALPVFASDAPSSVAYALHFTPGIMVISVPYQLHSSQAAVDRLQREDPLAWRPIGTGLSQSEMDRVEEDA